MWFAASRWLFRVKDFSACVSATTSAPSPRSRGSPSMLSSTGPSRTIVAVHTHLTDPDMLTSPGLDRVSVAAVGVVPGADFVRVGIVDRLNSERRGRGNGELSRSGRPVNYGCNAAELGVRFE